MNLDGEGEKIKAKLDATERPVTQALGDAHQQMMDRLILQIEQLTGDMQTMWDAGEPAPVSWLLQRQRMSSVLSAINTDVNLYGVYAQLKATDLQREFVAQGQHDATNLMSAMLEPGATQLGVDLTYARPPIEAMQAMAGRASNGAPLSDLFAGMGEEAAQSAKSTLLLATSLGTNPRQIADQLANDLGVSRNRALTIARTEGLGAYRDATLATYAENSDIVGGWMWLCTLSTRTCAECLAMDGEVFDIGTPLDSHPNCRCTQIPLTRGWGDILSSYGLDESDFSDDAIAELDGAAEDATLGRQTGTQWFNAQDAATQAGIVGKAGQEAIAAGEIELKDFVGVREDPVWGTTRYQKSLKEALTPNLSPAAIERARADLAQAAADYRAMMGELPQSASAFGVEYAGDAHRAALAAKLGREPTAEELAGLTAAPPGSQIAVRAGTITATYPDGSVMAVYLSGSRETGDLSAFLLGYGDGSVAGFNLDYSAAQIQQMSETANDLGITSLSTKGRTLLSASGERLDDYVRLPGYGFDATTAEARHESGYNAINIATGNRAPRPPDIFFQDDKMLSEALTHPDAAAWWEQYGNAPHLEFDTTPGSASMERLQQALAEEAPQSASQALYQGYGATANYDLTAEDRAFAAALKQQIGALDQASMTYQDAIAVGAQINDRIEADLTALRGYANEARTIRETAPNLTDAQRAWAKSEPDALAAHGGFHWTEAGPQYQAEYQARALSYLSEIRDMGGVAPNLDLAADLDPRVAEAFKGIQASMPSDWVAASNDLGDVSVIHNRATNSGGWFRSERDGGGQIALSYNQRSFNPYQVQSTALHEMMHRMESAIPRISQLEEEFYNVRTAGEDFVKLTNGIAQDTKVDQWVDPYIGREPLYTSRPAYQRPQIGPVLAGTFYHTNSYEILSVGAESVIGGGSTYDLIALRQDKQFTSFVLGTLASVQAPAAEVGAAAATAGATDAAMTAAERAGQAAFSAARQVQVPAEELQAQLTAATDRLAQLSQDYATNGQAVNDARLEMIRIDNGYRAGTNSAAEMQAADARYEALSQAQSRAFNEWSTAKAEHERLTSLVTGKPNIQYISSRDEQTLTTILGSQHSDSELAQMLGAQPGDTVKISGGGFQGPNALRIELSTEDATHIHTLYLGPDGPEIHTDLVRNEGEKTASSGRDILRQMQQMQELGIVRVSALAYRDMPYADGQFNGYYTWARLGFTGDIPPRALRYAQAAFGSDVTRVEQLMALPGGPQWWKAHGYSFDATFDFTPGSYSMQTFAKWQRALARTGGDGN